MKRRQLMYGAAAAAAGLTGAGVAWWQARHQAGASRPLEAPPENFWQQVLDTPEGQPLAMSTFAGRPLLLNFWATWCPPCIEELPLIDRFFQENRTKGWQVLGLAVDQPSAVRTWLAQRPLTFPVAMAGFGGTELSKSLGNLTGALPFSVVLGASRAVLHRKSGKLSAQDLALWASLG